MMRIARGILILSAVLPLGGCGGQHVRAVAFEGQLANLGQLRNPDKLEVVWNWYDNCFCGHIVEKGAGVVIYRLYEESPGFLNFKTHQRWESHLSIQIPDARINGEWDVKNDETLLVLSSGEFSAKLHPKCVGIATFGKILVERFSKASISVSVDVMMDFAQAGHLGDGICQSGKFETKFVARFDEDGGIPHDWLRQLQHGSCCPASTRD
jgi:hypothetical protein